MTKKKKAYTSYEKRGQIYLITEDQESIMK